MQISSWRAVEDGEKRDVACGAVSRCPLAWHVDSVENGCQRTQTVDVYGSSSLHRGPLNDANVSRCHFISSLVLGRACRSLACFVRWFLLIVLLNTGIPSAPRRAQ